MSLDKNYFTLKIDGIQLIMLVSRSKVHKDIRIILTKIKYI